MLFGNDDDDDSVFPHLITDSNPITGHDIMLWTLHERKTENNWRGEDICRCALTSAFLLHPSIYLSSLQLLHHSFYCSSSLKSRSGLETSSCVNERLVTNTHTHPSKIELHTSHRERNRLAGWSHSVCISHQS
jgi:hypothetical protein